MGQNTEEDKDRMPLLRAAVLLFNLPFVVLFMLGSFLPLETGLEFLPRALFLVMFFYVLNIVVALRGRVSLERPFGVFYQIGRFLCWCGNGLIFVIGLLGGIFLAFPLGTGLVLASGSTLWALFYTGSRPSPAAPAAAPDPFADKGDVMRDALTAEHTALRRRHKRKEITAELAGCVAAACGVFTFMALRDMHLYGLGFAVIGAASFAVWRSARTDKEDAKQSVDDFYAAHPQARPSVSYLHRVQERRLVEALKKVSPSLQKPGVVHYALPQSDFVFEGTPTPEAVVYTPPREMRVLSWPRALLNLFGILLFVAVFLAIVVFNSKDTLPFFPSNSAIMAGIAFAAVAAVTLLLRWRSYARQGYIPPEFRKSFSSTRKYEYGVLFVFAICLAYYTSVYVGMYALHESAAVEKEKQMPVMRVFAHDKCMRLPSLSRIREPLCPGNEATEQFPPRHVMMTTVIVKTSVYGDSIVGAMIKKRADQAQDTGYDMGTE